MSSFLDQLWGKAQEFAGDTVSQLRDAYVRVEEAKQLAPLEAAKLEQQNLLNRTDNENQQVEVLTAEQYQQAANQATNNLTGMMGLPQWAVYLLAGSVALLVLAGTAKLVRG